jgi:phosphatidylinositol alpha-mannosyltransferase
MRVAIVCPYDLGAFGGVQDQCFNLAAWLEEAGHSAWVIGPGEAPPGAVSLGPVRVVTANGAATPISLRRGVGRELKVAVRDADVIHVHEPLMPAVSIAATRLEGIPSVGTFHADPSRVIRRFYRVGAVPLRRLLSRLDVVTAVSPVAAQAIDKLVNARIVPNGLDTSRFETGPKRAFSVGFVGRDDPRKGLDTLLAAWPDVMAAVPEATLRVVSSATREPAAGVEFMGAVDETAKRAFLAETQVVCAPNLSGESFGIILVEAMASQCAVVASALPAFVNVLGDSGVLVKPGDAPGLAQALIRTLLETDVTERLAAEGRERSHRFDRGAVLAGYLEAYRRAETTHRLRTPAAESGG